MILIFCSKKDIFLLLFCVANPTEASSFRTKSKYLNSLTSKAAWILRPILLTRRILCYVSLSALRITHDQITRFDINVDMLTSKLLMCKEDAMLPGTAVALSD
ncbi:uncharacterized protein F5891DRAFT_549867 [Suillus fuscotomentosus]|uniref:Secreted protein n=1 Tax=Suillus fuscotomentosus TaxID=1912939 RepID=A0AAD4DMW4_9AGAM|nr:uncharacterized protein F5891DRAFT_549867 [Suillus fuscotomentosus]KAG1883541.1 hypothetical protein F5891DRAFT_549867 [Suillus fuscotomentosus]